MNMKLTNSAIGVTIGIMYIAQDHSQWLYKAGGTGADAFRKIHQSTKSKGIYADTCRLGRGRRK